MVGRGRKGANGTDSSRLGGAQVRPVVSSLVSALALFHAGWLLLPAAGLFHLWFREPAAPPIAEQLVTLLMIGAMIASDLVVAVGTGLVAFRRNRLSSVIYVGPTLSSLLLLLAMVYAAANMTSETIWLGDWLPAMRKFVASSILLILAALFVSRPTARLSQSSEA
jgi:hypothetical protein